MEKHQRISQYGTFRKMVKLFGLAQTFVTILLVHLSLVLGFYLIIEARSHPDSRQFIQGVGLAVIVCGLVLSFLWRFIAKLGKEGMLVMADIADGLFQMRKAEIVSRDDRVNQQGPRV
jgi:chromate transport protein ChrA